MMPKTAVILAAGLGSRLGDRTVSLPKGLLVLEGVSLVERSIRLLKEFGIEQIFIGTGYLSEHYDALAARISGVKCVRSPVYETTSSMYTLYNLRNELKEPFLLLESDLLYQASAIATTLEHFAENVILASGTTQSGDEVYVEMDSQKRLVNLSKKPQELKRIDAEFVGISKVGSALYHSMCEKMEEILTTQPKIDYEKTFVLCSKENEILIHKVDNLVWCEIDDESHLDRAKSKIIPQLHAVEGKL